MSSRKKRNPPRIASSLQVFMSFVIATNSRKPNVDAIFSKACFKKWLATRSGKIKHPPQAFHRTLISHLRGKDTRKPFPEPVEKKILELLRKRKSIWYEIFGKAGANVGKHGFRHKGYHELNQQEGTEGADEEDSASEEDLELEEANDEDFQDDSTPDSTDNLVVSLDEFREKRRRAPNYLSSAPLAVPYIESRLFFQTFKQEIQSFKERCRDMVDIDQWHDRRTVLNINFPDAWSRFLFVVDRYYTAEYFLKMTEGARRDGLDLFPPAVVYFLKALPASCAEDPRFNYSFCFPDQDTTQFYTGREVIRFVCCKETAFVLESSAAADRVLGYELTGLHSACICASLLELWYNSCELIPLLVERGVVWKRQLYKKANGENGLFLCRLSIHNDKYMVTEAQDISDLYPEFLQMPYFI